MGSPPDAAVAEMLAARVQTIDARIAELQELRIELCQRLRQQCPLSPATT
jgi:hypothetical protein